MRARSFSALLSILAAACALALGGCGGTEYAGVELSRYVPREYLAGVAASLDRAGQNGPELIDAIGESGVELPVIRIYARRGGEVILHSEGYDLNIERRLSRVIDDHLQELLAQ